MALGDSFYRKASAKIEQRIGEPVQVIGWASRTGAMGAVIAGKVVGGADVALGGSNSSFMGIPGDRMQTGDGGKGVKAAHQFHGRAHPDRTPRLQDQQRLDRRENQE